MPPGSTRSAGYSAEAEPTARPEGESQHVEWTGLLRNGGLAGIQQALSQQDENVRLFRCFQGVLVPGLVQTPEYAHEILRKAAATHGLPDGVDDAVRGRLRRQELLSRADKRFHMVLSEAVLRYRLVPTEVLLGQLDRLLTVAGMRNVRLGIIDFAAGYSEVNPSHAFWIHDDDLVSVETFSAMLNLSRPREIEVYKDAFDRLARLAVYGAEARGVISRIARELAREAKEAGA